MFISWILQRHKGVLVHLLGTRKIIKCSDVMVFEDKKHLDDCPSESVDEARQ